MNQVAPAVRMEGVRFAYPRGRSGAAGPFGLSVPHWQVAAGERLALFGPSGSGKSTLLQLVAGILTPREGIVEVAGRDLGRMGEGERRAHRVQTCGFVFQDFPLVEHLSAEENVLLPFRLNRALVLDARARERARHLLESLGVSHRAKARPRELSQGERQRVAIGRALVTGPAMLLADEPTAGLDPRRRDEVMELIDAACRERGLTLVMVTHDRELLDRFDRAHDIAELADAQGVAP